VLVIVVMVIVPAVGTVLVTVVVRVIMLVPMLMLVVVIVRVIMLVIVCVTVIMVMAVGGVAILVDAAAVTLLVVVVPMPSAVSAGFRLEGRLHRFDFRAKPPDHFFEHMVGGDAQEPVPDLNGDMSVAKVIRSPHEVERGLAGDMQDAFRLRSHLDYAPVACDDQVAAAQDFAARQHERHFFARHQLRAQPALLPPIERQLELAFDFEAIGAPGDFQLCLDFNHGRLWFQNRK
jgi:hypothetical protein